LTDDTIVKDFFETKKTIRLFFRDLRDRYTCPVGNNLCGIIFFDFKFFVALFILPFLLQTLKVIT
jgi:hypothetical protein